MAAAKLIFRPLVERGQRRGFAPWFRAPELVAATSGIYAVRSAASGQWLYIGSARSSRPGTLCHTVRRHFQKWESPRADKDSIHQPGVRMRREAVVVAVLPVDGRKARKVEKALQRRYRPRWNDPATYGDTPF